MPIPRGRISRQLGRRAQEGFQPGDPGLPFGEQPFQRCRAGFVMPEARDLAQGWFRALEALASRVKGYAILDQARARFVEAVRSQMIDSEAETELLRRAAY